MEDISTLLRLKRYEQPAPEYFDTFLRDFHRRQRTEFLKQPLWRIVLDRTQTFFGGQIPGVLSYGAAVAAAIAVFFGAVNVNSPLQEGVKVAQAEGTPFPQTTQAVRSYAEADHPRYVIDTRPVSYEQPSFSF